MARTKINTQSVSNASCKIRTAQSSTSCVASAVNNIRYRTDGKILGRNGIAWGFSNAQSNISQIATDIAKVYQYIESATSQYETTENNILREGRNMGLLMQINSSSTVPSENRVTYEHYFKDASGLTVEVEDSERAKNGWDYSENLFGWISTGTDSLTSFLPDDSMLVAMRLFGDGITFSSTTDATGKIRIVLNNAKGYTKAEMADKLNDIFSTRTWTGYDAKVFQRDGIALFKDGHDLAGYRNLNLSDEMKSLQLDDAIDNLKLSNASKVGKTFGGSFVDELTDAVDYRSFSTLSKIEKVGKVANTVGTGLTVVTNVFDNNYNAETGQWEFTGKSITSTVTDTAIDLGTGAAASAAGAAIGSLILPPVGTVVGAAAGLAIGLAINYDGFDKDSDGKNEFGLFDWDKDGSSDSLVDGIKYGVDSLVDWIFD